ILTSPALQDDLILSVIEQLKTQVVTCTKINQDNKQVNDLLTAELERYKRQERVLNESNHDEKASTTYEHTQEIDSLKHTRSEYLREKESFEKKISILKDDLQKEESRNIDRELALDKEVKELNNIVFKRDQSAQTVHMLTKPQVFYNHATRQALGFQNPRYLKKAQQLKPSLYDGSIIGKSDIIVVPDSENTIMHAEERLRRFFRYAMFIIYSTYVMTLYPFTERYAQPYLFSCLIRQRGVTTFQDLLQVVALFALALKDFHELVLAGDLLSIEFFVGEEDLLTLKAPAMKNSSYKGPNRRSNSCCDGTCSSAEYETFCSWGTRSELS
nr:hypothetical protein [Tanacetum cinerariifolium]